MVLKTKKKHQKFIKESIKKEGENVGSQCAQVEKPPNQKKKKKKFELPQPRPSITILESPTDS